MLGLKYFVFVVSVVGAVGVDAWNPNTCLLNPGNTFALFYADALVHVFPTTDAPSVKCPAIPADVSVSAAKAETTAFQLSVVPQCEPSFGTPPLRSISASVTDTAPGLSVRVRRVLYVNVTAANAVNAQNRSGAFPDPLLDLSQPLPPTSPFNAGATHASSVPCASVTSLWVEVSVSAAAATGTSTFKLSVVLDGKDTATTTVSVGVWPFQLPSPAAASQRTGAGLSTVAKSEVGARLESLKPWYDNLSQHRINRYVWQQVQPGPEVTPSPDGQSVVVNGTAYFAAVDYLVASGVTGIRFPVPQGGNTLIGHAHVISPTQTFKFADGFPVVPVFAGPSVPAQLHPNFTRLFEMVVPALAAPLQQRGLLNQTWSFFVDEPIYDDAFTLSAMEAILALWRRVVPDVRHAQTRFPLNTTLCANLIANVDAWIAHVEQYTTPGVSQQMAHLRASRGVESYIYDNGIELIDTPWVRVRSFPWMIWQTNSNTSWAPHHYGLQGSLSWYSVVSWSADPYALPSAYCPGHHPPCPAGWGYLLYPSPLDAASNPVGPPVDSIRWQHFLAGLYEAEYFALLQAAAPSSPALFGVSSVVWNFTEVTQYTDNVPYVDDPQLVHNVVTEVATALAKAL